MPIATDELTAAWETFFRTTRRLRSRAGRQLIEGLSLPQYHLLEPLRETDELAVGVLAEGAGVAGKAVRPRAQAARGAEEGLPGGAEALLRVDGDGHAQQCSETIISLLSKRPRGSAPTRRLLYAVVSTCSPSSAIACSRILYFCTLPVTVIGNSSANFT